MPLDVEALRTEVLQPHLAVSHRSFLSWLTEELPPAGAFDAHEPKIPFPSIGSQPNGPVSPTRGGTAHLAVHHIGTCQGAFRRKLRALLVISGGSAAAVARSQNCAAAGRLYSLFAAPTGKFQLVDFTWCSGLCWPRAGGHWRR